MTGDALDLPMRASIDLTAHCCPALLAEAVSSVLAPSAIVEIAEAIDDDIPCLFVKVGRFGPLVPARHRLATSQPSRQGPRTRDRDVEAGLALMSPGRTVAPA